MATVVLVGRPNTGKSTLFNRLVGGRVAITLREPGITRDRIIRTAEWLGNRFQVIDTGGLVPGSEDEMAGQIERQVRVALEEADVVVLVVDGQTGPAPLDEEIGARLHKEGRPFLLAVNKLDARRDYDSSEFHGLGGEKLLPISAEHGIGVDDLLDEIISRLPEKLVRTGRDALALAILGRPNVGKSSFLNALLGDERAIVTATPGTTRDVVEENFQLDKRVYRLLDTAGIRKQAKVHDAVEYYSVSRAIDVIERCNIALLVVDATEGPTSQDKKLASLIEDRGKGLIIVANKMDLVPSDLIRKVQDWTTTRMSFVGYAPVVFTSALRNEGIADAVRQAGLMHEAGGRHLSNALLRETALERIQRKPPKYNCRVLGLSQLGTRPPLFRLRLSSPEGMNPAYRRHVAAEIRRCFPFQGYPIRIRTTS